jgi:hypothetical protein
MIRDFTGTPSPSDFSTPFSRPVASGRHTRHADTNTYFAMHFGAFGVPIICFNSDRPFARFLRARPPEFCTIFKIWRSGGPSLGNFF